MAAWAYKASVRTEDSSIVSHATYQCCATIQNLIKYAFLNSGIEFGNTLQHGSICLH